MLPPEFDLPKRRPVWEAMSEIFLDNERDETDYRAIAEVCARSDYSERELDQIFTTEVAPALFWNFYQVAGEWMLFSGVELERRILRPRGMLYWLERLFFMRPALYLARSEWKRVKEIPYKSGQSNANLGPSGETDIRGLRSRSPLVISGRLAHRAFRKHGWTSHPCHPFAHSYCRISHPTPDIKTREPRAACF
jgi:hypothetical protein